MLLMKSGSKVRKTKKIKIMTALGITALVLSVCAFVIAIAGYAKAGGLLGEMSDKFVAVINYREDVSTMEKEMVNQKLKIALLEGKDAIKDVIVEYSEGATVLAKANKNDASYDLCVDRDITIVNGRQKLSTGIKLKMPEGIHCFIMPTSGNSTKGMNARKRLEDGTIADYRLSGHIKIGTVDNCYRGEIGVTFDCYEHVNGDIFIKKGTKVAQVWFAKEQNLNMVSGKVENDTERGDAGFGHTDKLEGANG